jgi:hypothetical protein
MKRLIGRILNGGNDELAKVCLKSAKIEHGDIIISHGIFIRTNTGENSTKIYFDWHTYYYSRRSFKEWLILMECAQQ